MIIALLTAYTAIIREDGVHGDQHSSLVAQHGCHLVPTEKGRRGGRQGRKEDVIWRRFDQLQDGGGLL